MRIVELAGDSWSQMIAPEPWWKTGLVAMTWPGRYRFEIRMIADTRFVQSARESCCTRNWWCLSLSTGNTTPKSRDVRLALASGRQASDRDYYISHASCHVSERLPHTSTGDSEISMLKDTDSRVQTSVLQAFYSICTYSQSPNMCSVGCL